MTYGEYCILEYAVYGKHKDIRLFTKEEMCGWLDNYHRYVPTQKEIDESIRSLLAQGMLIQTESQYLPSEDIMALWKASRYLLGDFLGLDDCTRSRFQANVEQKYGIVGW